MKKLAILSALLLALPAAADRGSDNRKGEFHTFLTGYQEVPSVSTVAEGLLTLDLSDDGLSANYTLTYQGLQGSVLQAHIHLAQKSVNGVIMVWLCGTATLPGPTGTPTCPASGTVSGTINAASVVAPTPAPQQIAAGDWAEFVAAVKAGVTYANVHTNLSPGGEIRGQLRRGRAHD